MAVAANIVGRNLLFEIRRKKKYFSKIYSSITEKVKIENIFSKISAPDP